jgi:hypothetical protein
MPCMVTYVGLFNDAVSSSDYIENETKFAHKLSIVWFLVEKQVDNLCPVTFSFKETRHRQMAQGIVWSNHGHLVVTIRVLSGLRPFQGRRQCAARHSLEHTLTCWHRPLSQPLKSCHEIFDSSGRDCVNLLLQVSPQKNIHRSWIRRPRRPCSRPSTFLDMSRSTTAGHLPHNVLELRRVETTTSASQLEAHLQTAPVEQFPENHDIVWAVNLSGSR